MRIREKPFQNRSQMNAPAAIQIVFTFFRRGIDPPASINAVLASLGVNSSRGCWDRALHTELTRSAWLCSLEELRGL